MYKRFWTICVVVGAALLVLSVVGLSSLGVHERGLRAERQGQFVAVAEQIRFDVKSKLDDFLQAEQRRPYTDYQYAYVPETTNEADALVRSPLADSLTHGLAFGHFQIDAAGTIVTPYAQAARANDSLDPALAAYLESLTTQVLVSLNGQGGLPIRRIEPGEGMPYDRENASLRRVYDDRTAGRMRQSSSPPEQGVQPKAAAEETYAPQGPAQRSQTYRIESFVDNSQTQTMQQSRGAFERNISMTRDAAARVQEDGVLSRSGPITPRREEDALREGDGAAAKGVERTRGGASAALSAELRAMGREAPVGMMGSASLDGIGDNETFQDAGSTVQIRIEPFAPLIVPGGPASEAVFPGEIFLVRHVQIEGTHLLQGFRLHESELAKQVQESARRLLREGMSAELGQAARPDAAHTAILDFGFGELVLNLLELESGWITARVATLNTWMTTILLVVWLAVLLALFSLWRNLHEQVTLARKKDDFLSAVSHELRTPLTSIRMYTEMLEKGWVKDEAKRVEYYGTMRQESERLTRLIENVLDFSRIQRGKKQFSFTLGDVNGCLRDVVEMMRPCAERAGFVIEAELSAIEPFAFDRDAVMQIVINLIDNALKYAKDASDKRIIIRSRPDDGAAVIEVEDRGPGVPKSQQQKIFEAFYRCGDESTRQTTGTGLGLALVKRFAEAHRGVVEILNAKPTGAVFRVRIAR